MLTVAESAAMLGVSAARVRQLIAEGSLPAQKIGHAWVLDDRDVAARLLNHPSGGRPRKNASASKPLGEQSGTSSIHDVYLTCKDTFSLRPSMAELSAISDPEERAFRVALADFFLQFKQRQLVQQGVF